MVGHCYVCKIDKTREKNESVSIHRIPKDAKTRTIWFGFIGRETNVENGGICSKHFKPSDFIYKKYGDGIRRCLKPGSCPSILQYSRDNGKDIKFENVIDCAPLTIESDTNPETDINRRLMNREKQECIIIDETESINSENSIADIHLKRELDDPLAIMEDDLKRSMILGNEMQELINVDKIINSNLIDIQLKRKTNDPLPIVEYIDLETSIENEVQESININKTVMNTTDNHQLKRKKKIDFLTTRKRLYPIDDLHRRDLHREDFTSDESWYLFKNYSKDTKIKIRSLEKTIIYLNEKVNDLKEKVNYFKDKAV